MYVHSNIKHYPKNKDNYQYDIRDANKLKLPVNRLTTTQGNAEFLHVKLYNRLPEHIKILPSNPFQIAIMSYLLDNAFYCIF